MTVLGFCEQHARQERAERHRQTCSICRPGGTQRYEQRRKGEQVGAARATDFVKQRARNPPQKGQHQSQREACLQDCRADAQWIECLSVPGQGAFERQKRNESEILEQEDPDGDSGMGAIELGLLTELADDDCRRGHGERATDQDRNERGLSETPDHGGDGGGGQYDLRAADPERLAAHGDHARQ